MISARDKWRFAFDAVSTVALVAACATLILRSGAGGGADGQLAVAAPLPVETIEFTRPASNVSAGKDSAKIVLLAYLDFECPFCARFGAGVYPSLKRDYIETGLLRYEFHHFPLDRIHPTARRMSAAVECAGAKGAYWPMHDRLVGAGPRSDRQLLEYAGELKLDETEFETCLRVDHPVVTADITDGEALGVSSTPTFFVGRVEGGQVALVRRIQGALPYSEFKRVIDEVRSGL